MGPGTPRALLASPFLGEVAMQGHGERKFTAAGLLASSTGLGWSALAAEVRGHAAGPIPAFVTEHTELTLILRSDGSATVLRAAQGVRQQAAAAPGTTFLIPVGTREEATYFPKRRPALSLEACRRSDPGSVPGAALARRAGLPAA